MHRLALGALHLLVDRLQEIVDLGLGGGDGRLDASLGCAFLAQMQLSDPAPFDLSELDHSLAILAKIANHLYHDLVNFGATQTAALEEQHFAGSRGE
jgi:hypothetical protein